MHQLLVRTHHQNKTAKEGMKPTVKYHKNKMQRMHQNPFIWMQTCFVAKSNIEDIEKSLISIPPQ